MTDEFDPTQDTPNRRLRAMWAFSGLQQGEFVKRLGNGASANLFRHDKPPAPTTEVLEAAADLVGWSREFARHGPAAIMPPEETIVERVDALEARMDALVAALRSAKRGDPLELIAQVLQTAAEVAQATRPGQGASAGGGPGPGPQGQAAEDVGA